MYVISQADLNTCTLVLILDSQYTLLFTLTLESRNIQSVATTRQIRLLPATWFSASRHISFELSLFTPLHSQTAAYVAFLAIFPPQLYHAIWCLPGLPSLSSNHPLLNNLVSYLLCNSHVSPHMAYEWGIAAATIFCCNCF